MSTHEMGRPASEEPLPRGARSVIYLLSGSVALMMTGVGIVVPTLPRRLEELGGGAEVLALLFVAFAVGQFLLSPLMGALADRVGRKPLVLVALVGVVLANLGYIVVSSTGGYVALRLFHGAMTAGLLPAATAMVADLVPEKVRGQWVGVVMGSYAAGFVFGPGLGGVLYDLWGFVAPFLVSAGLGFVALLFSAVMLTETRPKGERRAWGSSARTPLVEVLPRPLYLLAALLFFDFAATFPLAFVEPEMPFYFYDRLGFSTTQFGIIVSVYGLALLLGQMFLGNLSDRYGRKLVIALGFALNATFFLSLALATSYTLLLGVAVVAGLGAALVTPALSAFYLDVTAEAHRSRVLGIKGAAAALGYVVGPLLVAILTGALPSQIIFALAALLPGAAALFALMLRSAAAGNPTTSPAPSDPRVTAGTGAGSAHKP